MIVANSAGTFPMPKNIRAGIRYTKLGMVCIPSSRGLRIDSVLSFLAILIPDGIPISREKKTEAITRLRVLIESSQYPNKPIKSSRTMKTTPVFHLPISFQPASPTRGIKINHGTKRKSFSNMTTTWRIMNPTASKKLSR